jgi:hypothetical protein
MATVTEELKRQAMEIAQQAVGKIPRLDAQLAEIWKKKAALEEEREKARGSLKRAADFPLKFGADYFCPVCWVNDDHTSTLRPVPSNDRRDIFRCNACHFETTI